MGRLIPFIVIFNMLTYSNLILNTLSIIIHTVKQLLNQSINLLMTRVCTYVILRINVRYQKWLRILLYNKEEKQITLTQ
jgi:hypothetical protein